MRRICLTVLPMLLCLLCACGGKEQDVFQGPMAFRTELLACETVRADLDCILEDETEAWPFTLAAAMRPNGAMEAVITAPESLEGITAHADQESRRLTFDGVMVDFGMSPAGLDSPILVPRLLMEAWCSGWLVSAGKDRDLLLAVYELDYGAEAKTVRTWFDAENHPVRAELVRDGKVQCTVRITDFTVGGINETAQEDLGGCVSGQSGP